MVKSYVNVTSVITLSVASEVKVFFVKVIFYIIREHIMGRSHINVIIVIKTYVLKSKFTCHQKTQIGEKPFKCKECDKSFVQKVDLACHQRTHNGEKLCKCDQFNNIVHLKVVLYVIC